MSTPEGNSFPESLNVSRDEVEEKIDIRGIEVKQNELFPEGTEIKCLVI